MPCSRARASRPILEALAVARAARRMALQNFAIALGYNAVFVPLAMAGPRHAAARGRRHVRLLHRRHRQRRAAQVHAPGAARDDRARLAHPLRAAARPAGLVAFLWSLDSGQYDDLDGAGWRALQDDDGPDR